MVACPTSVALPSQAHQRELNNGLASADASLPTARPLLLGRAGHAAPLRSLWRSCKRLYALTDAAPLAMASYAYDALLSLGREAAP